MIEEKALPVHRDWQLNSIMRRKLRKGKGRILLVEDDADISSLLLSLLKEKGYLTDHAKTPEEAERLRNTYVYDKAIIDANLKNKTDKIGLGIAKKIREDSPNTECIIASGTGLKKEAKALGLRYIQKPYTVDTINNILTPRIKIKSGVKSIDQLLTKNERSKEYYKRIIKDDSDNPKFKDIEDVIVFDKGPEGGINRAEFFYVSVTGKLLSGEKSDNALITFKRYKKQEEHPKEERHTHSEFQKKYPCEHEARMLRSFSKANVVPQLYDVIQDQSCIVMETIPGNTLEEILINCKKHNDEEGFMRYIRAATIAAAEFHHIGTMNLQKKPIEKELKKDSYNPMGIVEDNLLYDSNKELIVFEPTKDKPDYYMNKFLGYIKTIHDYINKHSTRDLDFEKSRKRLIEAFKESNEMIKAGERIRSPREGEDPEDVPKSFIHGDLHPENILVHLDHDPKDENSIKNAIRIIDLFNTRVGPYTFDLNSLYGYYKYKINLYQVHGLMEDYLRKRTNLIGEKTNMNNEFWRGKAMTEPELINSEVAKYAISTGLWDIRSVLASRFEKEVVEKIDDLKNTLDYLEAGKRLYKSIEEELNLISTISRIKRKK